MPVAVNIPLHLLDEPEVAMRSEISDDYLRDLADNIAAHGLINPISVTRNGERFTIAAGHCRYLAHKLLNRPTIEARDYTDDEVNPEALKIAENVFRSDVSDADIATYLHDIQEKYHYDIDTLMRLTRRSEGWINARLGLFRGDLEVFAAMQRGEIKLGHAVILNRFPDGFRPQYLKAAIQSTPPIKVMEQWLLEFRKMNLPDTATPADAAPMAPTGAVPGVVTECCELCGGDQMPWAMRFPRVHDHCMKMILDKVNEAGS